MITKYICEVCWLKVPAHCGVPGNEQADALANEGRLDSPLYLLPAVLGGTVSDADDDDRVAEVQDMMEDYSCLDHVAQVDSVQGVLNFDSAGVFPSVFCTMNYTVLGSQIPHLSKETHKTVHLRLKCECSVACLFISA